MLEEQSQGGQIQETEAGPFPPLVKFNQHRNISHAFNSAAAVAEPGSG